MTPREFLESAVLFGLDHLPEIRAARVVVAIERFRRAQGERLPGRLEALVPEYLASLPVDPFSGAPLRYRADGAGYVVYSVAMNRQDDGGDVDAAWEQSPSREWADRGFRIRFRE